MRATESKGKERSWKDHLGRKIQDRFGSKEWNMRINIRGTGNEFWDFVLEGGMD